MLPLSCTGRLAVLLALLALTALVLLTLSGDERVFLLLQQPAVIAATPGTSPSILSRLSWRKGPPPTPAPSSVRTPAPTQSLCSRLLWVHFPKTSSALCMALQHACCPADFEALADTALQQVLAGPTHRLGDSALVDTAWGCTKLRLPSSSDCRAHAGHGHDPLPPPASASASAAPHARTHASAASLLVVMLREPRSRILSAYLDGRHTEGLSAAAAQAGASLWRNASLSTAARIRAYALHPDMKGCQTKMLLGWHCCASVTITANMQAKAIRVVQEAFFVGLFEKYSLSVARLHAAIGQGTVPHTLELTMGRSFMGAILQNGTFNGSDEEKGAHEMRQKERNEGEEELRRVRYRDAADDALYAAAARVFEGRARARG